MKHIQWRECLSVAVYYAPRGRRRLLMLGETIGQRYLEHNDQLIGVMGESGTGKSSVVRGMFPGLELTNDDQGINVHPTPLIQAFRDGKFRAHTYHIDVRYEMAFVQLYEIAEALQAAIRDKRRIVVEHFEIVYPTLGINAQFLLGVGEELIAVRPDLFGPFPADLGKVIEGTAVYRKMAHSAEDITAMILERDFGFKYPEYHSDVPRGFVIEFPERPEHIDLNLLEKKVLEIIAQGLPISYLDEDHIQIGETAYPCTGPRIHLHNSSDIQHFRIVKEMHRDPYSGNYCLVGLVGEAKAKQFVERHPEDTKLKMAPSAPLAWQTGFASGPL